MTWRSQLATASLMLAVGCGDNIKLASDAQQQPDVDAAKMSSPCWLDTYTPGGSVELGTGELQFTPMGDQVALEYGSQLGFDIPVNSRITGMLPGNPSDPLDPNNPRTRFHGYFMDTGAAINPGRCGIRLGYVPSSASTFDLVHGGAILFDTSLTGTDLFGRQVLVVLEVIDSAGNYATTQKVVTCEPPPGWPM
jgi:hypothetical protein